MSFVFLHPLQSVLVHSGVVLNEIGLAPLFSRLIQQVLSPLAVRLFPDLVRRGLSHEDFFASVVNYDAESNVDPVHGIIFGCGSYQRQFNRIQLIDLC